MGKPSGPAHTEMIPCEVCRKEIPLTEALIPEAEDYIVQFCGLECYAEWKKQGKRPSPQGSRAGK